MDETQALRLARSAIRQGDKAAAQRLLVQVVTQNPRSEIAWLWLSALEPDRSRELHCLDKVLEINPNNEIAKRHKLRLIEREPPDASEPAGTAQTSPEVPLYCPRCNAPTRPGVRFCPTCGGRLSSSRVCSRCGREGPWPEHDFNDATGQCTRCGIEIEQALKQFRLLFLKCDAGLLEEHDWAELETFCIQARLPLLEALLSVKGDALRLMQRIVTLAQTDGAITPRQQEAIYALQYRLQLTHAEMMRITAQVRDSRLLEAIRQGHIPAVEPTIVLGAGESCYWEEQLVVFEKLSGRRAADRPGTLIITNRRVMFLSEQGGTEIPIKRIVRVSNVVGGVQLELSRGPGAGYYSTSRPDIVAAILLTLVHHSNHQAARAKDVPSRRIPDDVKTAVWQRDQGRCVQCGATDYLEFDHIIPVSKGGANTVDNVQVLCRRCNLRKGSSIS